MFKIKWRNRNRHWRYLRWFFTVFEGISRYPTHEAAARQVAIWQRHFPHNTYYIEPV